MESNRLTIAWKNSWLFYFLTKTSLYHLVCYIFIIRLLRYISSLITPLPTGRICLLIILLIKTSYIKMKMITLDCKDIKKCVCWGQISSSKMFWHAESWSLFHSKIFFFFLFFTMHNYSTKIWSHLCMKILFDGQIIS